MTPADHQQLAGLVLAGRVTREQAAWLAAEVGRRGVSLGALLAEKGITGPTPPSATVAAAPPSRATASTPAGGVPLAATVAAPPPADGGSATPGPLRAVDAEQLPPEVRAALADPRRRIGRWVSLSELGRGANGVVHRAFDPLMGRAVAIKQMLGEVRPEELERFRREVVAGGQLRHPGIVGVHEVGVHQGAPFLVMELVEGQSLERLLVEGRLDAGRALEVVRQVALALAHAHGLGIIHRDVKPANILVDGQGAPRLGDFGLARLGDQQGLTRTGQVLGTPTTMAPEQAAGEQGRHGPATDVWALGAMLYRIVTGRPPFQASTFQAQLTQILFEKPRAPSALAPMVDPRLEALILRCLEKEPAARPTAADVAAELTRIQTSPPPRSAPRRLLVGVALLLVLGSSVLGAVAARRLLAPEAAPVTTATASAPPATEAAPTTEAGPRGPPSRGGLLVVREVRGETRWCNGPPIGRLATSSDGKEVVVVGLGTFRRFDTTTGESVDVELPMDPPPKGPDDVNGLEADWGDAVALDERGLAARGDRTGRILLHRRGEATCRALTTLAEGIGALCFDGTALLAGTPRRLVRIPLATGTPEDLTQVLGQVRTIVRVGDAIHCVTLSGALHTVRDREGVVSVVNVVARLNGQDMENPGPGMLTGLATDGTDLFLSLQHGRAALVRCQGEALEPLLGGDALSVEFVGRSSLLLVGNPGGNRLFRLSSKAVTPLPGHVDQAHGAARLASGACSGGYDGLLFAWGADGQPRGGPSPRLGHVTNLSASPTGRTVVSTGNQTATTLWTPGASPRQLAPALRSLVLDDERVALWTRLEGRRVEDNHLLLVDPTGAVADVAGPTPVPASVCVTLLPGRGGGVLSCDEAGVIRAWSLRGKEELAVACGLPTACAAVSPDRSSVVVGGADGRLLLLPLDRPEERVFLGLHDGVSAVAFDGPGRVLSVGRDRALRSWQLDADPREARTARGHTRAIGDVAPLGDGRAVTCARDGTVRLWSEAGEELDRLDLGPQDLPSRLAVAQSGRRVYVGTWRGQLLTVDVGP